ncbi:MAG: flavin prenyltransferase UbiX [Planctomycetia bacterium]|nr:flavin prenyltransferase UbiX [Planctomycetia bacterium]
MNAPSLPIVLAITGASGAPYALRLLEVLLRAGREVRLSISPAGQEVLRTETGRTVDLKNFRLADLLSDIEALSGKLHYDHFQNLYAPIASGSSLTSGMVICPCSGGTMSAIAHGTSQNLIHRAADVHLKERRKLILVPRETPLSIVQLNNYKLCAEAGAIVLPAMPGFYHGAKSIADLVDFVVARICDQLEVPHQLMKRWGES